MSPIITEALLIEAEIARLPEDQQYLVRECAHQLREIIRQYRAPGFTALALVAATAIDLIPY